MCELYIISRNVPVSGILAGMCIGLMYRGGQQADGRQDEGQVQQPTAQRLTTQARCTHTINRGERRRLHQTLTYQQIGLYRECVWSIFSASGMV